VAAPKKSPGQEIVCRNKRARIHYTFDESFEAGVVLVGSEVKSLRAGQADLVDAYARIDDGELFLLGANIPVYKNAGTFGHEPRRTRKLLVHKAQIRRLQGKLTERGFTLVPLSIYWKEGRAKIELGLGKGKKHEDRRDSLDKKESDKELREVRKVSRKR
jgi:SsrA-binding protein